MAERFVPCTCPACKGSLVTRYTCEQHTRLYSDIEVAKEDKDRLKKLIYSCAADNKYQ